MAPIPPLRITGWRHDDPSHQSSTRALVRPPLPRCSSAPSCPRTPVWPTPNDGGHNPAAASRSTMPNLRPLNGRELWLGHGRVGVYSARPAETQPQPEQRDVRKHCCLVTLRRPTKRSVWASRHQRARHQPPGARSRRQDTIGELGSWTTLVSARKSAQIMPLTWSFFALPWIRTRVATPERGVGGSGRPRAVLFSQLRALRPSSPSLSSAKCRRIVEQADGQLWGLFACRDRFHPNDGDQVRLETK
jgi:hypothetical protein